MSGEIEMKALLGAIKVPCDLTVVVLVISCMRRNLDFLYMSMFSNIRMLRPVLLAGRDREQRWFRGRRDLDCSAPRVRWLRTPLRGKAEVQGTRPSKPKKKGTHLIGNSRGIAVRVGRLLVGFGQGVGHLPVSVT